ncbi:MULTISPECIES: SDR family oxidoreductase [unclassified Mesobacillus]|uniref:SDR family NAD(P)-dependent oxidoreductase n=1 Tax=unclassified Mesobacillus TaxID=2675270 RepID=UPI002041C37E|nr:MULTISPECIES: SDR family oxidoreductase [unclassified Mesobacillus]MCM3122297.1 SDR family oxidoreductase [Mesobacillus sp. MER 33]MCM3232261.1 SDR family oxidoreductase [Mesobacillus sp. MER 48]
MQSLKGKNIIITGASGGIGAEIARLCAARGANLVLLARSIDKLEILKKELQSKYAINIHARQLDVSDPEAVKKVFFEVLSDIRYVDILVNNAGFGVFDFAHEVKMDEIKSMFDVNVVGLIACTSMVLPGMKQRQSGHIINIASQAGKIATPKSSVYSATKHAVLGYTNSLRMEVADDRIFVTSVNPGPIETNFFNIADKQGTYVKSVKRFMLKPEYVAKQVVDRMMTNSREINLPRWMNAGSKFYALFPRTFELFGKNIFNKK